MNRILAVLKFLMSGCATLAGLSLVGLAMVAVSRADPAAPLWLIAAGVWLVLGDLHARPR